ncbi:type II secretion system protein GspD [Aquabacterium sp. UBA2148]|uniref:type II secretion system protein GspD n=1 Tax=Aquabacterium sp. UBA2148 TaxID=1946042 RepID=UPI00257F8394|nr:type II and III secretion system protein [Aquabacterium sp. UBA2148]
MINKLLALMVAVGLSACANKQPVTNAGHLRPPTAAPGKPPALINAPLLPPPPTSPKAKAEVFSISVHNVDIRSLLFAIARDARLNLDIHPDLAGTVSMNAVDQTVTEILDRVALQANMRYEMEGRNLFVMPDAPVLKHYRIDYLNVARESRSEIGASTSISRSGSGTNNSSSASLTNVSSNRFWETLTQNLRDLLRETDKIIPEDGQAATTSAQPAGGASASMLKTIGAVIGAAPAEGAAPPAGGAPAPAVPAAAPVRFRESASVIANPESGVVSVRATYRQHMRVREFIDRVMKSASRQVMIEATIVEVNLSDEYQQGINWTVLRNGLPLLQLGPAGAAMPSGVPVSGIIPSMLNYTPTRTRGNVQVSAALRLLESFGNAKVLSSPKISALNNQAAMLKVTEDLVYFTLTSNYTPGTAGSPPTFTVTSTPNNISVGLVMSVMPQVGEGDEVSLILRPTLSRVVSYVDDPAVPIFLSQARNDGIDISQISSRIPQIQTREMESVIKVNSGDTAVLGGLMRDDVSGSTDQTPGVGDVPLLGELFKYKQKANRKSELVIFLRPTVVRTASLTADHQSFGPHLGEALRPMPERMPLAPETSGEGQP